MAKPSVYIETTIVSYLTCWPSRDIVRRSHEIVTQTWWSERRGDFELYTSEAVIAEASAGDSSAAAARLKALDGIPRLAPTEPAMALARQLATTLGLPVRAYADAVHLAIAAANGMAFLLTWNCRHLANGALAARIEEACVKTGVVAPRVLTPQLLLEPP